MSNNNKIIENIKKLISEHFENDIDDSLSFEENGINSVTFVKIAISLENEMGIQFEDEDFDDNRFNTLTDFYEYVTTRCHEDE